jgi:type VI secretion system protein ImpH
VQLVEDFFGVPASVDQFVGGWFRLDQRDRCAVTDDGNGPGNTLGGGAVLGDEIWDAQARVRVRLGPMDRERYQAFLPGGPAHRELDGLLRFFTHDQFECEVQLVLDGSDVPGVRLGQHGTQRLGWTTWIQSVPRHGDADDTVLTLDRQAAS